MRAYLLENKMMTIQVIPAKAGIQFADTALREPWIPACAGMTASEGVPEKLLENKIS